MRTAAMIFAEQLDHLAQGHALWYPEPTKDSKGQAYEVHIGDVGYIDEDGAFYRLFNITLDASHELNSGGVPDGFEPVPFDHAVHVKVKPDFWSQGPLCSRSIKSRKIEGRVSG